jgi:N-acetylglucosaminyldiphosphoundecaprenol N-acetyl-beta-D-mannosaminyltransferase
MTIPASYRLFGYKITPTTAQDLFDMTERAVDADARVVIASQNLHGLYVHARDPVFRALHEDPATCVHIDGTPILWLGRLAGLKLGREHRTAWIDWFLPLLDLAERKGWRVFYLGARPEVLEAGFAELRRRFPRLSIDGQDGYFDQRHGSPGNDAVIRRINGFRPQILIVGMGMGRQEQWISENRAALEVNCIGTCGACIEYFAGAVPTPPRWLGPLGLEWAYRLASDPARFWRRYLVEPWAVAWKIAAGLASRRRPPLERIGA